MTMDIMHSLAVKLRTVFSRMLPARRHGPVIAMAVVEMMVDMSVKMFRSVEPGSRSDKYTARKPLGAVVTVWRAVIRGLLVISIRTNRRLSNTDCNLCISFLNGS